VRKGKRNGGARRTRLTREERRAQLVEIATGLLEKGGTDAVRHIDVADRAGVTRQMVHQHFPTRGDLIAAMIEDYSHDVRQGIADAVASGAERAEDLLQRVLEVYFEKGRSRTPMLRALALSARSDPVVGDLYADIFAERDRHIIAWIRSETGLDRRAAAALADCTVAVIHALCDRWGRGELTRKRALDMAHTIIVASVRACEK
jgi:AcrR family transcriptional regulator